MGREARGSVDVRSIAIGRIALDGVVDPEGEGRDLDVHLRVRDPTENEVSNGERMPREPLGKGGARLGASGVVLGKRGTRLGGSGAVLGGSGMVLSGAALGRSL